MMSDHPDLAHSRADVDFLQWQLDCSLWWKARNDQDVFDWPAYPWRQWYDDGLTVAEGIAQANIRLFGRPQGC